MNNRGRKKGFENVKIDPLVMPTCFVMCVDNKGLEDRLNLNDVHHVTSVNTLNGQGILFLDKDKGKQPQPFYAMNRFRPVAFSNN
jgi:hypothetical protein